MRLLAIDTATECASIALSVGAELYSVEQMGARQHAQFLLPMVQKLLNEQAVTWSALDGIVLDVGPGSFTGLRIGCSIAKALAYAHGLPVYGVSSMQALAHQVRATYLNNKIGVFACGDARMQEVYWAYYAPQSALISDLIQVSPVDTLPNIHDNEIVIAGWGLDPYLSQLPLTLKEKCIAQVAMYPKAESLIRLVLNGDVSAQTAEAITPLYVRNQVTHGGEARG